MVAGWKEPHLARETNSSAIPRVCSGPEAFLLLQDPSPEIPALESVMSQVMMSKRLGQVPVETLTESEIINRELYCWRTMVLPLYAQ